MMHHANFYLKLKLIFLKRFFKKYKIIMTELTIEFNCDFNENNNGQNLIDEPLADFSFKFIYDIFTIRFCSEVRTVSYHELEDFINKFKNNNSCSVSFNDENGSRVSYNENKINFHVYTYKEGSFTILDNEFELQPCNHSEMIEHFNTLLRFKEDYDIKISEFYREEDDMSDQDCEIDPAEDSEDDDSNDN